MNRAQQLDTPTSIRTLCLLVLLYIFLWALIPSLFFHGMYLDSSENIAWAMHLAWGNYKHPPLGAWLMRGALTVMPTAFSAVVFLSAACVLTMYVYLYRLGRELMSPSRTLLAILMTSTLYYFNSRSLQFNQNVMMLPLWAAMGYYFYQSLQHNQTKHWVLLGVVTGLAVLAKYESAVLIIACLGYLLCHYKRAYTKHLLLTAAIALLLVAPNFYWVVKHNYLPLHYMNARGDTANPSWFASHIKAPFAYLASQLPLLIYPLLFAVLIGQKNHQLPVSKKWLSLTLGLAPFLLVFCISLVVGMNIPTEWSYPFYIFTTLACVSVFKWDINQRRLKVAIAVAIGLHVAIFSYYVLTMYTKRDVSALNKPAAAIAHKAYQYWQQTVPNKPLEIVIGDDYFLGLIPAFEKAKPQAILNYSFEDSPYLNPELAAKTGAMDIVFDCPQGEPTRLKRLFPHNKISAIKCFTTKTVNTFYSKDFQFGVYIIYPQQFI
ncbi:MAG: glycosyltransferase family 39 protein [Coxiellaceae bacterium]|nr:glycosyltransferase family 39 protein [Coxiellaceae bacterium]